MIDVALIDGDACVAVLGHEVDGLLDGLVSLDGNQVGARNHDFTNTHIPHLEDAVDHLPFFFLEHTLFFANRDQHFEFFFGNEGAAHLGLAAQDTQDKPRDGGQDIDNWPHHEGCGGHQPRQAKRNPLGALQRQGLGCDLAHDKDEQRKDQADQPLGNLLVIKVQRQ